MRVTTQLRRFTSSEFLQFEYSDELLQSVFNALCECEQIDLHLNNVMLLSLSDSLGSAEIEGAHTTLSEVMSDVKSTDTEMVRNSLSAMQYLMDNGVSRDTVHRANSLVLGATKDGYRESMVYIGNLVRVVHTPAPVEMIPELMDDFYQYSLENKIIDSIVKHFYFVYVHPYIDGNGRTARAIQRTLLTDRWLPIAKAISCHTSGYYKSLQESEKSNDISDFVEYMLYRLLDACTMYKLFKSRLTDEQGYLLSKIDHNGGGEISMRKASAILGPDAQKTIKALCRKGFLKEVTGAYRLVWR